MKRRGTFTVCLGLIAALVTIGVMAMSAAATPFHVLRCVPYPLGNYKDPRCTEPVLDGQYKRIGITEGESVPFEGTETTNFVVTSTVSSVEVSITCKSAAFSGSMENPEGGGTALFGEVEGEFGECTVAPGAIGCKVSGGSISTTSLAGSAVSGPSIELAPESGEIAAEIPITGCLFSMFNKTYKLTGTATGTANNEDSSVEFTPGSGSELELDGEPATLTGTTEILSEESTIFIE